MPLPTPNTGESQDDFVSRCMADELMNSEHPDNDERYAICVAQWGNRARAVKPSTIERRFTPASEMRIVKEGGKPARIAGYAALFNSRSLDLGGFVETLAPGAFTAALEKDHDVRALFNHDPNLVLARTKSGTLRLKQDTKGLWIEADLPDTQVGRDLQISMERGDVDQMSFAFDVADGGDMWATADDGLYERVIGQVDNLYDVSPVTYPAYPDTSVALRGLEAAKGAETAATQETTPETAVAGAETGNTPVDAGEGSPAAPGRDEPNIMERVKGFDEWRATDRRRALYSDIARRKAAEQKALAVAESKD